MKCKLSDVCSLGVRERVEVSTLDEGTYISTDNMLPNRGGVTLATSLPAIDKTQQFKPGDILVSNIRIYFKKIWRANCKGGCSNDVLVFRAKENIDPDFLYYVLSDDAFFAYSTATQKDGTKMPRGDKDVIMRYQIELPPLETQRKIGSILSSLDDKIELNNRINANLEEQARAIFKSWFVDNPFQVEKETTLGNVCRCELGGTPSRNEPEYWNGNIPWINSGEVNEFRITSPSEYITEEGLRNSSTKLLPAKTTVLAITGATLGQVSLLEIESCANQSVVGIVPSETLPYEFIYPLILIRINELMSHQTGGAQQHINKQNIEGLPVAIPAKPLLDKYRLAVAPLLEMVGKNSFENLRLSSLRDALLPRLLSGELDVSKLTL